MLDDRRRLMTALLNHTSLSEVTDAAAPGAPCGPLDEADRFLKHTHCGAYGVESLAVLKQPCSPHDGGPAAGLMHV